MVMSELIDEKLKLLPALPGVYLMRDNKDRIIYVGKAVNLANRVRSYFHSFHSHDAKTQDLVSNIVDLEYIVTDTEVEALVLESILIQRHRPKYNILIPDNKHFLYIKATVKEDYPRLIAAHRIAKDGATYFGPFPNSWAVRNLVNVLSRVFKLRTCHKVINHRKQQRACLSYHINVCLGACIEAVSVEEYRQQFNKALSYLSGQEKQIVHDIEIEMYQAAAELQFEKAARLRDEIKNLTGVLEKQKIVSGKGEDYDIISLSRGIEDICVIVMFMREGHVIGRDNNFIANSIEQSSEAIFTAFIKQYYAGDSYIPREIIVDGSVEDEELLVEWLSGKCGSKVVIHSPQRGDKKQLALMARKNAMLAVEEKWKRRKGSDNTRQETLAELAHFLKLPTPPHRIECYDISNIQGEHSVGSMVVFKNGKAQNHLYRRFKIKTVTGPDDFASLKEVLDRRLKKLTSKDISFSEAPDLIIIDGGKGQLSAVMTVAQKLAATKTTIVSLAKREELIYHPGSNQPIILPRKSRSLFLIQRIRDEAHRFAIEYHRNLRTKHQRNSKLLQIAGIGPARQRHLLEHFGSIKGIAKAELAELQTVKGMTIKSADSVYQFYHKAPDGREE